MIGIDIGTYQSKAAIVEPSGHPVSVLNERGHAHTPSVVYVPEKGKVLVGTDAVEQGYLDPRRRASVFKLNLGSRESVLECGLDFDATDATTAVIAKLKDDVERTIGKEAPECVATYPANFRDDGKQALLEAFERNDWKVLALVAEPTAAAIAYSLASGRTRSIVLVYDYGGGTFDVSIVEFDGPQVTVKATEGIPKHGGEHLNQPIRDRILLEIGQKFGRVPDRSADPLLHMDIDGKAEAAKISLANRTVVPSVVGYIGSQIVVELTQEEFHRSIEPMIRQTLDAVDRALNAAQMRFSDINQLLMVGGTSRSPFIQDMVARHTGLRPKTDIDPEKVIAHGAAVACVAEMAKIGRTSTFRGRVIPDPGIFVRDVTAHGVGCCVIDASNGSKRLINSVVVPKNTPIPLRKVDHFFLEHEDQTEVRIEILQGEADADRDDCLPIGELVLDGLPKEDKRTQRIEIVCIIDSNGMVTATAVDKVSGKRAAVSFDYKTGIKQREKLATA
jgi:molecular chaperone DnaK